MDKSKHSFVVCAYKESKYLERCIQSLEKQTVKSNIVIATSTPNQKIKEVSEKYKIPLYINTDGGGIARDWNFAYSSVETEYVTIAHQDDIYFEKYTEEMMGYATSDSLLVFSDYAEIRNEKRISENKNLRIKRILLWPLKFSLFQKIVWIRRRVLSFGNPICCPSVMYVRRNLPQTLFKEHFRSNVDWETWENISKEEGRFVYVPQKLMGHRIHEESETSATIQENVRTKEDYVMFKKFWPDFIAKKLTKIYSASEVSNKKVG